MTRSFTPEEIFRILIGRRWLILVPFAIGLALAGPVGDRVPERYRSETLIRVVPQRVSDEYVRSTITQTVADRLPSINEQIMSRSRLERIIADLNLYAAERDQFPMEDLVAAMRTQVEVAIVGQAQNSFRVSYESTDPVMAQRVTERLAALYIEQNQVDRANQAVDTSQFILTELEDKRRQLNEHDRKLEDYRRRYAGELPAQYQGNLQAMQNAQLRLQNVGQMINRARERRLLHERQLVEARALPPAPVPGGPAAPSTPTQQLAAARSQLEALRLNLTPSHPDVSKAEIAIRELEKRVAEEEAAREAAGGEAAPIQRAQSPAEIAHELQIRALEAELEAIDRELADYDAEELSLRQTIQDYQAKIDRLPTRESELADLMRDYEPLRELYDSLVLSHENSRIAANLEIRQSGEQFDVIDPASLPVQPFNQRERLAFMAAAALGGLVLGLLLCGFLEYRELSLFRAEEDIVRALSLPVLALVPAMTSDRERKKRRLRSLALDAAGTGVVLAGVAVLVFWHVQV